MSIPTETTVLVVGGGPAGSYSAAALAREGINCVLLEADVFPRYHIGESMLASMRHFLRFIDLDSTFDAYGFKQKRGAAFKLNKKPEAFTDFIAAGGPNNYAWNVVRSEADNLMFQHAGKSGAKIFDGVKVNSFDFVPLEGKNAVLDPDVPDLGRPVSATWSRKDGSSGVINFEYLIDASGRAGLITTKYLKNRRYNQGLKNVAAWGYWKGASVYAEGTIREDQPFFESLEDASGWAWLIPLNNGTVSVGLVMNQEQSVAKKRAMGSPSGREFYLESLKLIPQTHKLLESGELVSEIKSAADWSYSASSYASPYVRVVGDAGCFIDPFFSSGVHLALSSALSACVTICAAKKGDCTEYAAAKWHSSKVVEGYTRFLLVVLSAMKQIRAKEEPVLSDFDEQGFERAFALFRPIIQGTADVSTKLSQEEISKTVDFCMRAFQPVDEEERDSLVRKLDTTNGSASEPADTTTKDGKPELETALSAGEMKVLTTLRARQMLRHEDIMHIDSFTTDTIDGMVPHLRRGQLGLVKVLPVYPKGADAEMHELLLKEAAKGEQVAVSAE